MDVKDDIEQYSNWFSKRVEFLTSLQDEDTQFLVCCSLIDALSNCVFCDKSVKERFVDLIEQFAETSIWTRVSIFHLVNSDDGILIKQNVDLKNYCDTKLAKMTRDINIYDVDPSVCEVQRKYDDLNLPVKYKDAIKKYKYSVIFYKHYRCGLVHEARVTTKFKFDYCKQAVPYYAPYTDMDTDIETKHLIIPVKFVINSMKTLIGNVKEWLIKNNINPYERHGLLDPQDTM